MIVDDITTLRLESQDVVWVVVPIYSDYRQHASNSYVTAIYISDITTTYTYIVPVNHSESLEPISLQSVIDIIPSDNVYVFDKKSFINHTTSSYHDIQLVYFLNSDTFDIKNILEDYYIKWSKFKDINTLIPLSILYDRYYNFFKERLETLTKLSTYKYTIDTSTYTAYNSILKTFNDIERVGIQTTSKLEWSHYNLYNTTGRPSNRFNGVNYAALNKTDDTRTKYISRFVDGVLVQFDYEAFHPTIIANFLKIKYPTDESIHTWLGKKYFGVDKLSSEQYEDAKKITFYHLYGKIGDELMKLDFFRKIQSFIDTLVDVEYLTTPLYKRRIDVRSFSPQKKFNYFLQSFESEINFVKLSQLISHLSSYKSKAILYTYDSFLIDCERNEVGRIVDGVGKLLQAGNFNITVEVGKNYKDMKKINPNMSYIL